jgi:hypothetical protein
MLLLLPYLILSLMFLKDTSSSKFTPFIQIFFFTIFLEFFVLVPFVQAVLKKSVFLSACHNHEDTGTLTAFIES